jgi:hypothetical protein
MSKMLEKCNLNNLDFINHETLTLTCVSIIFLPNQQPSHPHHDLHLKCVAIIRSLDLGTCPGLGQFCGSSIKHASIGPSTQHTLPNLVCFGNDNLIRYRMRMTSLTVPLGGCCVKEMGRTMLSLASDTVMERVSSVR